MFILSNSSLTSVHMLDDLPCSIKSSFFSNLSSSDIDDGLSLATQSGDFSDFMLDEVEFDTDLEE